MVEPWCFPTRRRRRRTMQNSHLRLGQLEYQRSSVKTDTHISVHVSHYIGEKEQAHLLSYFGNDAEVAAVTAAIQENHQFNLRFPDGSKQRIGFGADVSCYKGNLNLPQHKKSLRHVVAVSSWLHANGSAGRTFRRCQVFATFTGEHDVPERLERVLRQAGFRVAVLRASVPALKREQWYEKQISNGVEVVIGHPKLVETGLDLLWFPTIYFYQTGYSLHTLRQASRRSWRIGQRFDVRVKFLNYDETTQRTCLRLMGRKMLVALMMEGKFSGEGIHSLDADDDLLAAMARELVQQSGVGQSADAVWDELRRERAAYAAAAAPELPKIEDREEEPMFTDMFSELPAADSAPV